ncbi:hypothetical protein C1I98_16595 [Spongiactinospora gelatinilytica]|uniref:DUF6294 domain-containing protein n=1 Tax=Spongiactinospora gelatinilytica TaxID=2666298 RepID=A0A2W2HF02_9ACTN|nr:DUF6294 family protein [Spongiactinospora gelatinilytica]PZG44767.1 hypothetical protein C1I98_16595 [Spongiactinospora gelatinilytica]
MTIRRTALLRRCRTLIIAIGTALALLTALGGTAQAQNFAKTYYWNYDIHAGDCTMFHGASWTLNPDGTARFYGVVTSSDDNDAWLMWANLKNSSGQHLGRIVANTHWDDLTKFVFNLPDSSRQYVWQQNGTFNPSLYSQVASMSLDSHC